MISEVSTEKRVAFPKKIGPLYFFASSDAANAFQNGAGYDGSSFPYGIALVPERVKNDGSIPAIAYEGFLWTGRQVSFRKSDLGIMQVPGRKRGLRDFAVFRLRPNRANGVYVADNAIFHWHEQALGDRFEHEEAPKRRRARKELDQPLIERAKTVVPVVDYTGCFEDPVFLFNRKIDHGELKLISNSFFH